MVRILGKILQESAMLAPDQKWALRMSIFFHYENVFGFRVGVGEGTYSELLLRVGGACGPFGNTKNLPLSIPQRLLGACCTVFVLLLILEGSRKIFC